MKTLLHLLLLLPALLYSDVIIGGIGGGTNATTTKWYVDQADSNLSAQITALTPTGVVTKVTLNGTQYIPTAGNITVTQNLASVTGNNVTNFNAQSLTISNSTTITWNSDDSIQSLEYTHPDGGTITINGETYNMFKNVGSVPITNGQPVCIFGGQGRVASVKLADADDSTCNGVIGVYTASSNLLPNAIGRVTIHGDVKNFDLDHMIADGLVAEGNKLWLSTTAGQYQTNAPAYPAESILVGTCTYAGSHNYDIRVSVDNAKPWPTLDTQYAVITNTNIVASASNAGRTRYYTTATNSYIDVCMKTNATNYGWINVQSFGW